MQKILFFNQTVCDFTDKQTGKRVHGLSIKGLEKDDDRIKFSKVWVDAGERNFDEMVSKASKLVPGQLIELDYSASGPKKIILTDIIPSEELALDFDSIL